METNPEPLQMESPATTLTALPLRPNLHLALLCSESGVNVELAARLLKYTLVHHTPASPSDPNGVDAPLAGAVKGLQTTTAGTATGSSHRTGGARGHSGRKGSATSASARQPETTPLVDASFVDAVKRHVVDLERAAAVQQGTLTVEDAEEEERAERERAAAEARGEAAPAESGLTKGKGAGTAGGKANDATRRKENAGTGSGGAKKRTGSANGQGKGGGKKAPSSATVGPRTTSPGQRNGDAETEPALSAEEVKTAAYLEEHLPDCELVMLPVSEHSVSSPLSSSSEGQREAALPVVFLYRLHQEDALLEADASARASATSGDGSQGLATALTTPDGTRGVDWEDALWRTLDPVLKRHAALCHASLTDLTVVWAVSHPRLLSACRAKPFVVGHANAVQAGESNVNTETMERAPHLRSVLFSKADAKPSPSASPVKKSAVAAKAATTASGADGEVGIGSHTGSACANPSDGASSFHTVLWQRRLHPRMVLYLNENGFQDVTVPSAEDDDSVYFLGSGKAPRHTSTSAGAGTAVGRGKGGAGQAGNSAGTARASSSSAKKADVTANTTASGAGAQDSPLDAAAEAQRELEMAASSFPFFHNRHTSARVDEVLYTCETFSDFVAKAQRLFFQRRFVQRQRAVVFPLTLADIKQDDSVLRRLPMGVSGAQTSPSAYPAEALVRSNVVLAPAARELLERGAPTEQWFARELQRVPSLTEMGTYLLDRLAYREAHATYDVQDANVQGLPGPDRRNGGGGGGTAGKRNLSTKGPAAPAPSGAASVQYPQDRLDEENNRLAAPPIITAEESLSAAMRATNAPKTSVYATPPEAVWHMERLVSKTATVGDDPALWITSCTHTLRPLLTNMAAVVQDYREWCGARCPTSLSVVPCVEPTSRGGQLGAASSSTEASHPHEQRCVSASALRATMEHVGAIVPEEWSPSLETACVYQRESELGGCFTILTATQALVGQATVNTARREPIRLVKPADQSAPLASLTLSASVAQQTLHQVSQSRLTEQAAGSTGEDHDSERGRRPSVAADACAMNVRVEQGGVASGFANNGLNNTTSRRLMFRPYSSVPLRTDRTVATVSGFPLGDAQGSSSVRAADLSRSCQQFKSGSLGSGVHRLARTGHQAADTHPSAAAAGDENGVGAVAADEFSPATSRPVTPTTTTATSKRRSVSPGNRRSLSRENKRMSMAAAAEAEAEERKQQEEAQARVARRQHDKRFALPTDHTHDRPRPLPFPEEAQWLVQHCVKKGLGTLATPPPRSFRAPWGGVSGTKGGKSLASGDATREEQRERVQALNAAASTLRKLADLQGEQHGGAGAQEAIEEEEERMVARVFHSGQAVDMAPLLLEKYSIPTTAVTGGGGRGPSTSTSTADTTGTHSNLHIGELLERYAAAIGEAAGLSVAGGEAKTEELQALISRSLAPREKEHTLNETLFGIIASGQGLVGLDKHGLQSDGNPALSPSSSLSVLPPTPLEEKVSLVTAASRIEAYRQRFGSHNTALYTLITEVEGDDRGSGASSPIVSRLTAETRKGNNRSVDGRTSGNARGEHHSLPPTTPAAYASTTADNIYPPRRPRQLWLCGLTSFQHAEATPAMQQQRLWVYPWKGMMSLEEHEACRTWLAATASGDHRAKASQSLPLSAQRQLVERLLAEKQVNLPSFPALLNPRGRSGASQPHQRALHALHLAAEGKRTFRPFANALVELTTTRNRRTCTYIHETEITAATLHYNVEEVATRDEEDPLAPGSVAPRSTDTLPKVSKYLTVRYDDGVTLTVTAVSIPLPTETGAARPKPSVTLNGLGLSHLTLERVGGYVDSKRVSQMASAASPLVAEGMPRILDLAASRSTRATMLEASSPSVTLAPQRPTSQSGDGREGAVDGASANTTVTGAPSHATVGNPHGRQRSAFIGKSPGASASSAGNALPSVSRTAPGGFHGASPRSGAALPMPASGGGAGDGALTPEEVRNRQLLDGLPVQPAVAPFTKNGDVRLWPVHRAAGAEPPSAASTRVVFNLAVTTNHFVLTCHEGAPGNSARRTPPSWTAVDRVKAGSVSIAPDAFDTEGTEGFPVPPSLSAAPISPSDVGLRRDGETGGDTTSGDDSLVVSYFHHINRPGHDASATRGADDVAAAMPAVETVKCAHDTSRGVDTPLLSTREIEVRRVVRTRSGEVVRSFASGTTQTLFPDGAVLTRYPQPQRPSTVVETLVSPLGLCYARRVRPMEPLSETEPFVRLTSRMARCERLDATGSGAFLVSREDGVCTAYYPCDSKSALRRSEQESSPEDEQTRTRLWKTTLRNEQVPRSYIRVVLHADGTTITTFPSESDARASAEALSLLLHEVESVEAVVDGRHAGHSVKGGAPRTSRVLWCVESPRMPRTFLFSPPSAPLSPFSSPSDPTLGTCGREGSLKTHKVPFYVSFGDGTALLRRPTYPQKPADDASPTTHFTTPTRTQPDPTSPLKKTEATMEWETVMMRPTQTTLRLYHQQRLAILEPGDVHERQSTTGYPRLHALAVGEGFPVFDLAHGGLRLVDHRQHVLAIDKLFAMHEDVEASITGEPVPWVTLLRQLVSPTFNPHRTSQRARQQQGQPEALQKSTILVGATVHPAPPRGTLPRQASVRWKLSKRGADAECFPPLVQRLRTLGEAFITDNGLLRPESIRNFMRQEAQAAAAVAPGTLTSPQAVRKASAGLSAGGDATGTPTPGPTTISPLSFVQLMCGDVMQYCTDTYAQQALRSAAAEEAMATATMSALGYPMQSTVQLRSSLSRGNRGLGGAAYKHQAAASTPDVSGVEQLYLYRIHTPSYPSAAHAAEGSAGIGAGHRPIFTSKTTPTLTACLAVTGLGGTSGAWTGSDTATDPTCGWEGAATLSRYAHKQQRLLAGFHCGTSPAAFLSLRTARNPCISSETTSGHSASPPSPMPTALPSVGASSYWLVATLQPPPLYGTRTDLLEAMGGPPCGVARLLYRVQPSAPAVKSMVLAEAVARRQRLRELCEYHRAVSQIPTTTQATAAAARAAAVRQQLTGKGALSTGCEDGAPAAEFSAAEDECDDVVATEETKAKSDARAEQHRLRQLYYAMKGQAAAEA